MAKPAINGEMIFRLRMRRDETQDQFARVVGVTPTTISNWEREVKLPRSPVILRRLAELMKLAGIKPPVDAVA